MIRSNRKPSKSLDGVSLTDEESLDSPESVLEYAEAIQAASSTGSSPFDTSSLSQEVKAEVALIVFMFQHINRVISCLLGEEMSTSLFSVPESMAKSLEKPIMLRIMARMMTPIMKSRLEKRNKAGFTESLHSTKPTAQLPDHLQGIQILGEPRTLTLSRIVEWVDTTRDAL